MIDDLLKDRLLNDLAEIIDSGKNITLKTYSVHQ